MTSIRTRLVPWVARRSAEAREDDRGSILSEYGTLLGVMAVGAVGAGAFILGYVQGWLDSLPTP